MRATSEGRIRPLVAVLLAVCSSSYSCWMDHASTHVVLAPTETENCRKPAEKCLGKIKCLGVVFCCCLFVVTVVTLPLKETVLSFGFQRR